MKTRGVRVVHVTTVHPPFDTRIYLKECVTLASEGFDVVLVAAHDTSGSDHGITLQALKRPRGRLERMTRTLWEAYRVAVKARGTIYHFHDAELIPIGLLLAARGAKVIYDVHEDLPRAVLHKTWIPRWQRRLLSWCIGGIEALTARLISGVVAATPTIATRFPPSKTTLVQNFPLLGELVAHGASEYEERGNRFFYVGVVTLQRGLLEMVRAMAELPLTFDARLQVVGSISSSAMSSARGEHGWSHVEYLGVQGRSVIAQLMGQARAGLVLFHPLPNHVNAQPNKLFEYMSAGLPVIASDFPLWREIVGKCNCGILVDPLSTTAISDAMSWILQNPAAAAAMGRRGQQAVTEQFNWSREAEKLVALYDRLLISA